MSYKKPIINTLPNVGYAPLPAGSMYNVKGLDTSTQHTSILNVDDTIALLEQEEADNSIYDYRWYVLDLCRDAKRAGLDHIVVYLDDGTEKDLLFDGIENKAELKPSTPF